LAVEVEAVSEGLLFFGAVFFFVFDRLLAGQDAGRGSSKAIY
jgi:hypothetical protein